MCGGSSVCGDVEALLELGGWEGAAAMILSSFKDRERDRGEETRAKEREWSGEGEGAKMVMQKG